jgi:acyl-ACP thioesterase
MNCYQKQTLAFFIKIQKEHKIMETIEKKILTPEERQANVDRFIKRWKEEKIKDEQEAKERFKTPEYQAILKRLREKNAERGIIIPEV